MELIEVTPWEDERCIIAFDGRVLEVFWRFQIADFTADSRRTHVKQLTVTVSGPDRKGRRKVKLAGQTHIGFTAADLEEPQWQALQPLLDALRTAGASFET